MMGIIPAGPSSCHPAVVIVTVCIQKLPDLSFVCSGGSLGANIIGMLVDGVI